MSLLRFHAAVAASVLVVIFGQDLIASSTVIGSTPLLMLAICAGVAVGCGGLETGGGTTRSARIFQPVKVDLARS